MNNQPSYELNAFLVYIVVAIVSALASVFIALIALTHFTMVSDGGLWAMAVMVLAPSLMGIGVSYFFSRSGASGSPGSSGKAA